MDKFSVLRGLYDPSFSSGRSDLDELFGLKPITDEERASWKREEEKLLQSVEPSQGRIPELSGDAKKRAEQLRPIFQEASQQTGVPVDLLMGLGHAESSFDPHLEALRFWPVFRLHAEPFLHRH